MRLATAAVVVLGLPLWACTSRPAPPARPAAVLPSPTPTAPATPTADVFAVQVAPLLAKKCTPCHVPGGQMYERLPFDDAATVRGAKDGILRRLKDPAERTVVEGWLASQPPE
jgi:hypothetical protein